MEEIEIKGYYPGVVGKITELHAVYYYENWGFDVSFETQVGRELSEFMARLDGEHDGLWVADRNGKFAGAIVVDGQNVLDEGARLRWFIVAPEFQGCGIGKALILQAVNFCKRRRFAKVYLWTFEGLNSARKLYEAVDFRLCEEDEVDQWGQRILEQKFELSLSYES